AGMALVAADRAACRVPVLRDGGHHRIGRLVERQHRRGGRGLGKQASHCRGARRLHRRCHQRRRLPAHGARHRGDGAFRGGTQPSLLASALRARGAQVPGELNRHGENTSMNANALALNLAPLLSVRGLGKSFRKPDGDELVVLDNVNLTLRPGEIVGLLGRSGSGKSTLLRLISGLDAPTAGGVDYQGATVAGPAHGIAMVFQSFALFPWLTVLENVQLGLEAIRLPEAEMRKRSLQAIDLIGLDGFESAYPRELSGGMRQRVGFARALVVHPSILLMDEPFSALDVLTAETLRSDFLDLWGEGQLPIRSVLLVTHNIEEAVQMCDRLLIFSTHPGRVVSEIPIDLSQPRSPLDPRFRALVERVYVEMTAKPRGESRVGPKAERFAGTGIGTALIHVS